MCRVACFWIVVSLCCASNAQTTNGKTNDKEAFQKANECLIDYISESESCLGKGFVLGKAMLSQVYLKRGVSGKIEFNSLYAEGKTKTKTPGVYTCFSIEKRPGKMPFSWDQNLFLELRRFRRRGAPSGIGLQETTETENEKRDPGNKWASSIFFCPYYMPVGMDCHRDDGQLDRNFGLRLLRYRLVDAKTAETGDVVGIWRVQDDSPGYVEMRFSKKYNYRPSVVRWFVRHQDGDKTLEETNQINETVWKKILDDAEECWFPIECKRTAWANGGDIVQEKNWRFRWLLAKKVEIPSPKDADWRTWFEQAANIDWLTSYEETKGEVKRLAIN